MALRADIIQGDLRALYVAWLSEFNNEYSELDDDDLEPFVFRSIYKAGKILDIAPSSIWRVISGIQKTSASRRDEKKKYRFKKDIPIVAFCDEDESEDPKPFKSICQASQKLGIDPKAIWNVLQKKQQTITSQLNGKDYRFKKEEDLDTWEFLDYVLF